MILDFFSVLSVLCGYVLIKGGEAMKGKFEKDEYLEALWRMQENGRKTMEELKNELSGDGEINTEVLDMLLAEDMATISDDRNTITLTKNGEVYGRRIIRAHRLAERLMYDAMGMGMDFEGAACEFEHTITDQLVNSICIMLGHPEECPHGLPIPQGACCKNSVKTIESAVNRLTDMKIGQSARIAYMNCGEDQELHRLSGLQIRPGSIVKLHQTYPAFVIECEGSNIAIDDEIAQNICVWQIAAQEPPFTSIEIEKPKKRSLWDIALKR